MAKLNFNPKEAADKIIMLTHAERCSRIDGHNIPESCQPHVNTSVKDTECKCETKTIKVEGKLSTYLWVNDRCPIHGTPTPKETPQPRVTNMSTSDMSPKGCCDKCMKQKCKCYNENFDIHNPCLSCANGDHDEHCQPPTPKECQDKMHGKNINNFGYCASCSAPEQQPWEESLKEILHHEVVYGNPTYDPNTWSAAIAYVKQHFISKQELKEQVEKLPWDIVEGDPEGEEEYVSKTDVLSLIDTGGKK